MPVRNVFDAELQIWFLIQMCWAEPCVFGTFLWCHTWHAQLVGGEVCFGSGNSPWSAGLVPRQHGMAEEHGWGKAVEITVVRKQGEKVELWKEIHPFGSLPVTHLLPPAPLSQQQTNSGNLMIQAFSKSPTRELMKPWGDLQAYTTVQCHLPSSTRLSLLKLQVKRSPSS